MSAVFDAGPKKRKQLRFIKLLHCKTYTSSYLRYIILYFIYYNYIIYFIILIILLKLYY